MLYSRATETTQTAMQTTSSYLLAVAALVSMPFAAQAAINKCIGADGKVVFSDKPCTTAQVATVIEAPKVAVPSTRAITGAITAANLPKDGTAIPNSELQQYDTLCAEDRRLLAIAASKVNVADTIGDQNLQLHRSRVDQRCNPQARLAAAQRDQALDALDCKLSWESLASLKARPALGPGYGDQSSDIAAMQTAIEAKCPAPN
jgi:hypothetical protein